MTSGRLRLWFYDLTLILGVCFLLFFRGLGASPFFDKQEAREALVIWELHHSGNWILPVRKDAWGSIIGCTTGLMVASFLFIQNFSLYIAREYTFKPFIERVLPAVRGADLFFFGSGDYPVIFYSQRHIPAKRGIPVEEKDIFYLLFWENEWKQIRNKEGLSLLDTSDAVDIDEWEHGHLLLVAVKT
jgi:hypothetical protein